MFLYKRSNGVYYLNYADEHGRRKSISTKAKRKPEALKFLTDFKSKPEPPKDKPRVINLKDLRAGVLKYVSDNMQPTTTSLYKTVFDNLHKHFSNKDINLVTNADIEQYKTTRAKEVSRATANKELTIIKAIFNIAIRFGWLPVNPVRYVNKLSIPEKDYQAFTKEETVLILNSINNQSIKNFVSFAFLTGARLNEIVNLQWRDVDFREREIAIRNKPNFKTKTGKIRFIPISNSLGDLLNGMLGNFGKIKRLFNTDEYVFKNPQGYKYNKNYVSKYFKEVLRKLNFEEYYSFHSTRHTFITNLIKAGVNINYVKEIAGHSELSTTLGYTHISTNDLKEAINKINL